MQRLTFKSFLVKYLKELSILNTSAVTKLDKEVSGNLRLREPLALYIKLYKNNYRAKSNVLIQAVKYLDSFPDVWIALQQQKLKYEYNKVYVSYFNCLNRYKNEADTKLKIRERVLKEQAKKNISNRHICAALNLNPGNINAFLKKGDTSKLSLDTAYSIYDYVVNINK